MKTDIPMLNRITLVAGVLVLAGIVLAAAVSLCGCDSGSDYLPDIRVDEVRIEQPVVPLEPADVSVTVWNRGVSGTGRRCRVLMTSDGGLGYEWGIPALQPREYVTLDGFLVVLDDCEMTEMDVTVVVDPDDVVSEADETNNSMTVSVIVGAVSEVTP